MIKEVINALGSGLGLLILVVQKVGFEDIVQRSPPSPFLNSVPLIHRSEKADTGRLGNSSSGTHIKAADTVFPATREGAGLMHSCGS